MKLKFPLRYLLFFFSICAIVSLQAQDSTKIKKKKKEKQEKKEKYEEEYEEFFTTDSIPSLEFEIELEDNKEEKKEEEETKKKKKKKKKKVYKGIKGKRAFTKKATSSRVTIQIFYLLKEPIKPENTYLQEVYFYDRDRKRIRQNHYHQVMADIKKGKPYYIMHGMYKKVENGQVREEGYYYIGAKDGYWRTYNRKNILQEKILYKKGFPEDSKITYYDGNEKIKEIIPIVHGAKHGKYYKFYENGVMAVQGEYKYDKKISLWRYFYQTRQRQKDLQYPRLWYEEEQGYLLRKWDKQGKLIYDFDTSGKQKQYIQEQD